MPLEELVNWIGNDGIAIAVAGWMVYWMTTRLEKKLDMIYEAVRR